MNDYKKQIEEYLQQEIEIIQALDVNSIEDVMNQLEKTRLAGGSIYICGNGGSAATASHFVCDFNKGVSDKCDVKYNFVCLSDNVPIMMAIANDINYEAVFEYQLRDKITRNDLFIGISGSGNSENVLRAAKYAKARGTTVVAVTGFDGGELRELGDISLHVPINNMQITEDIHMIFDHVMMYVLTTGE